MLKNVKLLAIPLIITGDENERKIGILFYMLMFNTFYGYIFTCTQHGDISSTKRN